MKQSIHWIEHQRVCDACKTVDTGRTATLANCCARGAPMLAQYLRETTPRPRTVIERDPNKVSAKELARVMRYKGDSGE